MTNGTGIMKDNFRIAIVGAGMISRGAHLPAALALEGVDVCAIVDPEKDRAQQLARDYGLEQIALERGGKLPSPSHMKALTDQAIQEGIDIILIQSQFDSENARILARETGSEIIQFDPLDPHWSDQMYYIAEQLNPLSQ